ncbi:hypothetical protein [Pectinatus frisingensis]|uniref:hypothetical protein n=1 Tax=Pectinatus frisingensis TaxID=865 RepID=UPI0018C555B3|nr:hypothetical protein [Pectinatus frisingensis]
MALKKFLFMCAAALITVNAVAAIGSANKMLPAWEQQKESLKLADAMQMSDENNSDGSKSMHANHEEMQEDDTKAMHHQMETQSSHDYQAHNHVRSGEATEVHEHQHDERTMGKPGEGPNWPFIEGVVIFNALVIVFAGIMKWSKKEKLQ